MMQNNHTEPNTCEQQASALIDQLNGLFKEYLKTQKDISAEKEACLLRLEYTPLPENEVLQTVVDSRIARAEQALESAALCAIHGGTMPKKKEAQELMLSAAYEEAWQRLRKERPDFLYLEQVKLPQDLKPADYASYQNIILNSVPMPSTARSREILSRARNACKSLIRMLDIRETIHYHQEELTAMISEEVEHYFLTQKLGDIRSISAKSLRSIFQRYIGREDMLSMNSLRRILFPSKSTSEYLISMLNSGIDPQTGKVLKVLRKAQSLMGIDTMNYLQQNLGGNRYADAFLRKICEQFSSEHLTELIAQNPYYAAVFRRAFESELRGARITRGLLDAIPETYPELFPMAREMQRHFVLHIGPTNSGKSYEALEALKQADTGVYLAPLRLLAYEKFEELNADDVWCSMKTGEEEILVPGATIRSSTIEVLDFSKTYDVAVIDEAQLIADPQRGSAWTMALLGVQAETIHVCLAPEAEQVLIDIIQACEDTYEIVTHERLVPLYVREYADPIFPRWARRGDAFIVFSRRDVHAAAAELQKAGHKCSIIYGNLPYDVRRGEVRRYLNGETDVIVATDAIGMGLNLPIKRVIFLELSKFDGEQTRQLLPAEIRQIAGRAGRYGIFPKGIVTSDVEYEYMEEAIQEAPVPIRNARIGFPYSLIGIDGPVSELMDRWGHIEPKPGFEVSDMSREITLARMLEQETTDKELVFAFVMFPFDEKNETLRAIWHELFLAQKEGRSDYLKWMPARNPRRTASLQELEEAFKICDILYHYADTFTDRSDIPTILARKAEISSAIMQSLSKEKLESRSCRSCGKPLPFRYPYGICRECFSRQHRRRRWK